MHRNTLVCVKYRCLCFANIKRSQQVSFLTPPPPNTLFAATPLHWKHYKCHYAYAHIHRYSNAHMLWPTRARYVCQHCRIAANLQFLIDAHCEIHTLDMYARRTLSNQLLPTNLHCKILGIGACYAFVCTHFCL